MDEDLQTLHDRLNMLRQEHRDLDSAISALEGAPAPNLLQIQRLKKRKLVLKDEIRILSARILPDIIA
jgi:hypothetical protein